eukprot:TRINITY_DN2870_c0_g2_i2.p1 TRINITY_DN2870_c0_g2~~TRINITY_DN2870_c0_g2_i2.p1  ORF type:complete len:1706 (-),score=731.31 TRINITY_DN2870_c0_g2_i2:147-5264(-)
MMFEMVPDPSEMTFSMMPQPAAGGIQIEEDEEPEEDEPESDEDMEHRGGFGPRASRRATSMNAINANPFGSASLFGGNAYAANPFNSFGGNPFGGNAFGAPTVPTTAPEPELNGDEEMEVIWTNFSSDINSSSSPTKMAQLVSGTWATTLPTRSTRRLLDDLHSVQYALFLHYARRCLLNLFTGWPADTSFQQFANEATLKHILHLCLALDAYPACQINPSAHLAVTDVMFKKPLIRALVRERRAAQARAAENPVQDSYLSRIVHDDCISILLALGNSRHLPSLPASFTEFKPIALPPNTRPKARPKTQHTAPVTGQWYIGSNLSPSVGTPAVVELSGATSIAIAIDPITTSTTSYQTFLTIFADEALTHQVGQLQFNPGQPLPEPVIRQGEKFWYTCTSSSWYQGFVCNLMFTVQDVSPPPKSESLLATGDLSTALVFMDTLLSTHQSQLHQLLLLLLRAITTTTNPLSAQQCCRAATRLFDHWKDVSQSSINSPSVQEELDLIRGMVDYLEATHTNLRSLTLTNWAKSAVPGPHLQALLELILAARRAVPSESKEEGKDEKDEKEAKDEKNEKDDKEDSDDDDEDEAPLPKDVEAFKAYRDGKALASLVDITHSKMRNGMTVSCMGGNWGGSCDNFVADVCVRGGRWFYEVTLETPPNWIALGWATRKWRPAPNNALNNDGAGETWSIYGPNVQYYHRASCVQPVRNSGTLVSTVDNKTTFAKFEREAAKRAASKKKKGKRQNDSDDSDEEEDMHMMMKKKMLGKDGGRKKKGEEKEEKKSRDKKKGEEKKGGKDGGKKKKDNRDKEKDAMDLQYINLSAGMVIGLLVDFNTREMQFIFNGRSSGVVFSGFDARDGLYPAVSCGQNCSMTLNFGRYPFMYPPDDDMWSPLEHPRIHVNSWLERYQHASQVSHLFHEQQTFPEPIIEKALEPEVAFDEAQDISFEVAQCDATSYSVNNGPECMLTNDGMYFQPSTPSFHVTFKVAGSMPGQEADVYLRGLEIQFNYSCAFTSLMVFMGNTKPDFDSFEWCADWNEPQFQRFMERKKSLAQLSKPHEPIAFATNPLSSNRVVVKLDAPVRGSFITLKFTSLSNLTIDRVKFNVIHGSHILGHLMGSPAAEAKIKELIQLLKAGAARTDLWSLSLDENVVALVNALSSRLSMPPMSVHAVMLTPTTEDLARFKPLASIPLTIMQGRFALIKYLNRLVTPLLHYVDVGAIEEEAKSSSSSRSVLVIRNPFGSGKKKELVLELADESARVPSEEEELDGLTTHDTQSLSHVVHQLKGLYFMTTKISVFDAMMGSASNAPDPYNYRSGPRVSINRVKAANAKENPQKDPDGVRSVFGQLFTQLRNIRYETLYGTRNQQMFNVDFMGEGSIDVGGPYRECLTNAIADLMSSATPLFIRSPNGRNDVGLNREKYVPNPASTSTLRLAMYEFVGALMGLALSTRSPIALNLPSTVWKQLLNEPLEISDLEAYDHLCMQALNELNKIDAAQFDVVVEQNWTTTLCNGQEVELKEGGKQLRVTSDSREEFCRLVVERRLSEFEPMLRAIQKGLSAVIPLRNLSLFSWMDLETMVCGNPHIDVEILRRHTVYQGLTASSAVVKWLWQALTSFNSEERQLFLRFVWGRNRLPPTEADWTNQFTINALRSSPDALPVSHTCFFSLDLPPYQSYEVLRSKLLFAIVNCQAIDIDYNASSSMSAWVDTD